MIKDYDWNSLLYVIVKIIVIDNHILNYQSNNVTMVLLTITKYVYL